MLLLLSELLYFMYHRAISHYRVGLMSPYSDVEFYILALYKHVYFIIIYYSHNKLLYYDLTGKPMCILYVPLSAILCILSSA